MNGSGLLRVEVTREFDDSTVAKILELVENASSKKAKVENFITKFARYYTPAVVIGAVILAVLPPPAAGPVLGGGRAPGLHLFSDLLPLRAGDLRANELFRRNRSGVQEGRAG